MVTATALLWRFQRRWYLASSDQDIDGRREAGRPHREGRAPRLPLGGSFGHFEPSSRNLKKDVALSFGAGSPSPTETFLCVLAIFLSRHDTSPYVSMPPSKQKMPRPAQSSSKNSICAFSGKGKLRRGGASRKCVGQSRIAIGAIWWCGRRYPAATSRRP
jgi:hypothetical protein